MIFDLKTIQIDIFLFGNYFTNPQDTSKPHTPTLLFT